MADNQLQNANAQIFSEYYCLSLRKGEKLHFYINQENVLFDSTCDVAKGYLMCRGKGYLVFQTKIKVFTQCPQAFSIRFVREK